MRIGSPPAPGPASLPHCNGGCKGGKDGSIAAATLVVACLRARSASKAALAGAAGSKAGLAGAAGSKECAFESRPCWRCGLEGMRLRKPALLALRARRNAPSKAGLAGAAGSKKCVIVCVAEHSCQGGTQDACVALGQSTQASFLG